MVEKRIEKRKEAKCGAVRKRVPLYIKERCTETENIRAEKYRASCRESSGEFWEAGKSVPELPEKEVLFLSFPGNQIHDEKKFGLRPQEAAVAVTVVILLLVCLRIVRLPEPVPPKDSVTVAVQEEVETEEVRDVEQIQDYGRITEDEASIYSLPPGDGGEIVGNLKKGDIVFVNDTFIESDGTQWDRILMRKGETAYIESRYILVPYEENTVESTQEEEDKNEVVDSVVVTVDSANIRNAPTTEGNNIIGSLNKGDQVMIIGKEKDKEGNEWYLFQLSNGNIAYISSAMVDAGGEKNVQK